MSRWAIDRCFNRIFRSSFNEANCCLHVSSSLRICRKLSSISSSFIPPNIFPRQGRKFKNYLTFRRPAQRALSRSAYELIGCPNLPLRLQVDLPDRTVCLVGKFMNHRSVGRRFCFASFRDGNPPTSEMGSCVFGTKRSHEFDLL
jgi:hypothetical protein